VLLVVLENHGYTDVVGSVSMPYLNGLIPTGGLATQYYANAHHSLLDYFELTTGDTIATDNDYAGPVTQENVVRELVAAGKTWKAYAESLPAPAFTGGDSPPYVKHHNPFAYFSDVIDSPAQSANMVDSTQLSANLGSGQLPNYSFIVPNDYNNGHDCPGGLSTCTDDSKLAAMDAWLQTNLDPILKDSQFKQDGLLIITFDESVSSDTTLGGGHVMTLLLGPHVKAGFQSITTYQHQSTLRLTLEALGVKTWPGQAATALSMAEFFQ
jgi:acid phosphatase